jgi:putative flippase GtrA
MFVGFGLCGLALSNLTVWLLAHVMPDLESKLVSVIVVFVWNFGTSRLIVFRARQQNPGDS